MENNFSIRFNVMAKSNKYDFEMMKVHPLFHTLIKDLQSIIWRDARVEKTHVEVTKLFYNLIESNPIIVTRMVEAVKNGN